MNYDNNTVNTADSPMHICMFIGSSNPRSHTHLYLPGMFSQVPLPHEPGMIRHSSTSVHKRHGMHSAHTHKQIET